MNIARDAFAAFTSTLDTRIGADTDARIAAALAAYVPPATEPPPPATAVGGLPTPLDFGGVLNDTTTAARDANKIAFLSAFDAGVRVMGLPLGTVYMPAFAEMPIPAGCEIVGQSPHPAFGSRIIGAGDIFKYSEANGLDGRTFRNFYMENEGDPRILIWANFTAGQAHPESRLINMRFGRSLRHLNVGGIPVGWTLRDCWFEGATGVSRMVSDSVSWLEDNIKDAHQTSGVQFDAGAFGHYDIKLVGGFREQHGASAVTIVSGEGKWVRGVKIAAYFEANGTAGGSADIRLINNGAGGFVGVSVADSGFAPHVGTTQTVRIVRVGTTVPIGTGGSHYVEGPVPLL